eukprot:Hpha_TRINITY_DN16855_c1_g1::TRINITY_DN16855_c1_g1_i1::g.148485::m.148485
MAQGRRRRKGRGPNLVTAALVASFSGQALGYCATSGHYEGSGWCYGLTSDTHKWDQQSTACSGNSMQVGDFTSADVTAITNLLAAQTSTGNLDVWIPAFCGTDTNNPGTGCTDEKDANSEWRFTDNSVAWVSSVWLSGQPNQNNKYCVGLRRANGQSSMGGYPFSCSGAKQVLCKVAASANPPPAPSPPPPPPSPPPVTSAPTKSPSTSAPTGNPTKSPSTSAPTDSPITSAPTDSPTTSAPTDSPNSLSTPPPTKSPSTSAPTLSPSSLPPPPPPVSAVSSPPPPPVSSPPPPPPSSPPPPP